MNIQTLSQYEHRPQEGISTRVRLCAINSSDLSHWYSKSIGYLFEFLRWNIVLYFGISLLGLFTFVPQLYYLTKNNLWAQDLIWWDRVRNRLSQLFLISSFPTAVSQEWTWAPWTQWALTTIWFLFWLTSYAYIIKRFEPSSLFISWIPASVREFLEMEDPREAFYAQSHPSCINRIHHGVQADKITKTRWLISGGFFILILLLYTSVQAGVQYWILIVYPNSIFFGLIASLIHSIWKSLWRRLCWLLTRLELHNFWDSFYRSYFIKVYFYDIATFSLFYLTQTFLFLFLQKKQNMLVCQIDWFGEQFFFVLVLDYFGFRLAEFVLAKVQNALGRSFRCSCLCSKRNPENRSDESFRYKFTVVEEYVKLTVRQYYILAGFLVVPMLGWVACLLGIFDYWRCLYKLIRLCASPRFSGDSFSNILFFCGCMNLLFATFAYPGLLWYLTDHVDFSGCQKPTWFQLNHK